MSKNSREIKVRYHGEGKMPKRKKNPNKADVSRMGYRDDSPYRSLPYIDVHTPDGTIDMSATGIPLWANGRILPPYSGMHRFDTDTVREIPLGKQGGWLDKYQPGGEQIKRVSTQQTTQQNGVPYSTFEESISDSGSGKQYTRQTNIPGKSPYINYYSTPGSAQLTVGDAVYSNAPGYTKVDPFISDFLQKRIDQTVKQRGGSKLPPHLPEAYQIGGMVSKGVKKALATARKTASKPKSSGSAHLREMVKMKQSGVNMEDFFENLDWANAGRSLWNNIKRQGAKVLTGGQELGPDASAISAGKRKWTAKNLGIADENVIVETNKAKWATPKTILIDDLPKNVEAFRSAGGKAILHQTGNKKKTLNELKQMLSQTPDAQIYTDLDGVLVDLQGGVRQYNRQAPKGVIPRRQFGGSAYYPVADLIYISPEDQYDDGIYAHEAFHRFQNNELDSLRLPDYYPGPLRRPQTPSSEELVSDYWNRRNVDAALMEEEYLSDPVNASFRFAPYDMMYNYVYNPMMYDTPWTAEGEAMEAENAFRQQKQDNLVLGPKAYKKKGGRLKKFQTAGGINYTNYLSGAARDSSSPRGAKHSISHMSKADQRSASNAMRNRITTTQVAKNIGTAAYNKAKNMSARDWVDTGLAGVSMVGHAIPHPVTQGIALGADYAQLALTGYDAAKAVSQGNYGKGAVGASAIAEKAMGSSSNPYLKAASKVVKAVNTGAAAYKTGAYAAENPVLAAKNLLKVKKGVAPYVKQKGGLARYQQGGPAVTRGIQMPDGTIMPMMDLPPIDIKPENEEPWYSNMDQAALALLPFATELGTDLVINTVFSRFPAAKKKLKQFFGKKSKEAAEQIVEESTKGARRLNMEQSSAANYPSSTAATQSSSAQSGMPAPQGPPTPEPPQQQRRDINNISDLSREERQQLFGKGSVSDVENVIQKELVKMGIVRKTEWQRKNNPESTKRIPKNVADFILNNNLGSKAREILDKLEAQGLTMDYNSPVFNDPDGLVNAFDYAERLIQGSDPKSVVARNYIKNALGDKTVNDLRNEVDKIRVLTSEPDILNSLARGETTYSRYNLSGTPTYTGRSYEYSTSLDPAKYKIPVQVRMEYPKFVPDPNNPSQFKFKERPKLTFHNTGPDGGDDLKIEIDPQTMMASHIAFFGPQRAPSDPVLREAWTKKRQLAAGQLLNAASDAMPINTYLHEGSMSLDSGRLIANMGTKEGTPFRLLHPSEYTEEMLADNSYLNIAVMKSGRTSDILPMSRINPMAKYHPNVEYYDRFYSGNRHRKSLIAGLEVQNSVLESGNSLLESQLKQGLIPQSMYDANVTLWYVDPLDPSRGTTTKAPKRIELDALNDPQDVDLAIQTRIPAVVPKNRHFNPGVAFGRVEVNDVYTIARKPELLTQWENGNNGFSDSNGLIIRMDPELKHYIPVFKKEFKQKGGQINSPKKYQFGGGTGPIGSFGTKRDWVAESMRRDIDEAREMKARQAAVLYDNMRKSYTAEPSSTAVKYQPVKAAAPGEETNVISSMLSGVSPYFAAMLPFIGEVAVDQTIGAIPRVGKQLQKAYRKSNLDENIASLRGYDIPYAVESNLYKTGIVRKGEASKPFKLETSSVPFSDPDEQLEIKNILEKLNSQGLELDLSNPIFQNKRGEGKKNLILEALSTADDIFHGTSQSSSVARSYLDELSKKPDILAVRNMLNKQRGYTEFTDNPARKSRYSAYHMSEDGDYIEFNTKSMGTNVEFTNAMGDPEMHIRLNQPGHMDDVKFKMNVEQLPDDNLLFTGLSLGYYGNKQGMARGRDVGKVLETAKMAAPKNSFFMEGSLSTDSYPMKWEFARKKNTPFRLITPREWVGGIEHINLFNRGHYTTLGPELGDKALDVLPVQWGNTMGMDNKFASTRKLLDDINNVGDDVTIQVRQDNNTLAQALKLQNHNVEIANKGLIEQYENNLINKDVYDANITLWYENPKDPTSKLVPKAPDVEIDDLLRMSPAERRNYLPQKTSLHPAFSMQKAFVNKTQRQTAYPVYNYWHILSDDNLLNNWRNNFDVKAETWMITPGFRKEFKKGGSTTNWLKKYK